MKSSTKYYFFQVGSDNEDTLSEKEITLPTTSTIVSLTDVTTPPQLLQVTIHGLLIQKKRIEITNENMKRSFKGRFKYSLT